MILKSELMFKCERRKKPKRTLFKSRLFIHFFLKNQFILNYTKYQLKDCMYTRDTKCPQVKNKHFVSTGASDRCRWVSSTLWAKQKRCLWKTLYDLYKSRDTPVRWARSEVSASNCSPPQR